MSTNGWGVTGSPRRTKGNKESPGQDQAEGCGHTATTKTNRELALERSKKIRELYEKDGLTEATIAERFGVTIGTVREILRHKKDDEAPARITG